MSRRPSIPGAVTATVTVAALLTALTALSVTPAAAGGEDDGTARYRGVITADGGIWLRDRPDRGSRIIGFAAEGEVVSIYCKIYGEPALGNPVWYLLEDGTWAWGPARFMGNIGESPSWC